MMTSSVAGSMGNTTGEAGRRLVFLGWLLAALAGCDASSFTPPRPAELTGEATATTKTAGAPDSSAAGNTTRSRLVEMILSQPVSPDRSTWCRRCGGTPGPSVAHSG